MSDLKARLRRWTKRIAIALAVFIVPPAAFYFYSAWQGERELRAVLDELDANDAPWRWDDLLAARSEVQEHEDVRAVVMNTRSLMGSFRGNWKITDAAMERPPNIVISSPDWERFNELMQTVEAALTEARKLHNMAGGRFQIALASDPLATNFDDLQKSREFVNLLHCAAAWHAQQGDLDAAADDCLAMQRLCQSFESEPTMIVHLVRLALQSISVHGLQRVLAQGQPAPERLTKLQRAWEQFDQERAMLNGLRGERAYCDRMFEAIASGEFTMEDLGGMRMLTPPFLGERVQFLYIHANLKQAHAWSLRHFNAQIKTLELPEPQRAARQRELDDEARNAWGAARLLMPAMQKVLGAHRRVQAQTRCAITGLAAERFRRAHDTGRWPKSLEELCPEFLAEVPEDPYSGKPLELRVAGNGIVIYSVGHDGQQRGMLQEDLAANQSSAIPYEFRLWNVNQRRLADHRQP